MKIKLLLGLCLVLLFAMSAYAQNPADCGNGRIDPGETCDDGNTNDGDLCDSTCGVLQCSGTCVNGFVELGEQCDDGNLIDTDYCTSTCEFARCGDGIEQPRGADDILGTPDDEECDDGDFFNRDTERCNTQCKSTFCGDGILQTGEQCEVGIPTTGVTPDGYVCEYSCDLLTCLDQGSCVPKESCGDGIVQTGADEECDDSGESDTCTAACKLKECPGAKYEFTIGEDISSGCDATYPDSYSEIFTIDPGVYRVESEASRAYSCSNLRQDYSLTIGSQIGFAYDDAGCISSQRGQNMGIFNLGSNPEFNFNHEFRDCSPADQPNVLTIEKVCLFEANLSPTATDLECQYNGVWGPCIDVEFGDVFSGMRAQCNDPGNQVSQVVFGYQNIYDRLNADENYGWFVPALSHDTYSDPWYTLTFPDIFMDDSGAFDAFATCETGIPNVCDYVLPDNPAEWNPLEPYMIDNDGDLVPEYYCDENRNPQPFGVVYG